MICLIWGTRPEELKFRPLIEYWLSIGFTDFEIYLSGQHAELCDQWYDEYTDKGIHVCYPYQTYNLPKNRLSAIQFQVNIQLSKLFEDHKYTHVIVQGDTTTALVGALTAFNFCIKVIHLEAGLRSHDNANPYPEEANRRMISAISDINLCPTLYNKNNLYYEKVPGLNYIVGNTILDILKNKEKELYPIETNKIICTLHRRENQSELKEWFSVLEQLAEQYPDYQFILPLHKSPAVYQYKDTFKYVKCIEPLDHDKMIKELSECLCVITDSGGITEEATWFSKPIHLCRLKTERPEAKEFYIQSGTSTQLYNNFNLFMGDLSYYLNKINKLQCPFGNGNSSRLITDILIEKEIIKLLK